MACTAVRGKLSYKRKIRLPIILKVFGFNLQNNIRSNRDLYFRYGFYNLKRETAADILSLGEKKRT